MDGKPRPEELTDGTAEHAFLVVAREHRNLLEQLRSMVGDVGWVQVIEDRRHDRTLLPRAGREGAVYVEPAGGAGATKTGSVPSQDPATPSQGVTRLDVEDAR